MSFKDSLEHHPVWYGGILVISAFVGGWSAHYAMQSTTGQVPVPQDERRELLARLDGAERERDDLKRELSALHQSRKAPEPRTAGSRSAAGGTKPAESPVSASHADDNLNIALLGALKIADHRIRDDMIVRIACQALRQGVADVAESATDSLSSAKSKEKAELRSAVQAIASPHRPSPNWTAICN